MSREGINVEGLDENDVITHQFFQEVTEYAIFLLDSEGHVASWNEGAERINGYTKSEILGRHFSIFYPDETESDPETVLSLTEERGSYEEKGWRLRKDGSKIWAQVTVTALWDDSDELRGFTKIVRDITETKTYQKELERNRDRLARTEALADVGGWELDLADDELYWTDGTRRLVGVSEEYDVTYPDVVNFFYPDDRETIRRVVRNARETGESFDIEVRIVKATGHKRWIQLRGEPVSGDETIRGVVRDITARKEREQRLMVLNRVLRHNLRNNLNVVSGYAESLKQDLEECQIPDAVEHDSEQFQTVLDRLSETTDGLDAELTALRQTVRAVSTFSREDAVDKTERILESSADLISTGDKARQFEQAVKNTEQSDTTSIQSVFDNLQKKYQRQYPDASITVTNSELTVSASVSTVSLAVDELLQNALEHNDDETPTVRLEATEYSPERLEITVADNGPGIPEMERAILQQGRETALVHGSGIGLWTVNWVVTQFGGSVSIDSSPTQGTAVTLTLPATAGDE